MHNINRRRYKELNNILWDTKQDFIEAKDALDLYERRWAYVDADNLDRKEQELIALLTARVGKGVFMPVAA